MHPTREVLVRDLVAGLAATEPSRPRLTWYGVGHERVELSGRVLANWVVKATNLLLEEGTVGPRTTVLVDLPPHWRSLVWAFATWTAGGQVLLPRRERAGGPPGEPPGTLPGARDVDVVVTDRPTEENLAGSGALQVAVALPALAMRFPGALPARAIDGAADLMTYGDALGGLPGVEPAAPALSSAGMAEPVPHAGLLGWARAFAPDHPPGESRARVLVEAVDAVRVVAAALSTWSLDGSIVLVGDPDADFEALARTERVTARA